jgi:peptide methionine sulfoxide reductase msrA/msrB
MKRWMDARGVSGRTLRRRWAAASLPILGMLIATATLGLNGQEKMEYNQLTPQEQSVIIHKGTERPFTGEYWDHNEAGTYVCRQCDAPLYRSQDKFDAHCGWPSFDDEIEGAVKRLPDADGRRTEIVCANCGGHLGHVFLGEDFTPKNTRHCVNSISMKFIPANPAPRTERAIFASGCFWGTEYHLSKVDGVISTTVGYTGGHKADPTYKQVSSGKTGHAEAVEVVYDPEKVSYEELARLYFETHDPTQLNRQGPDIGHQYRSAIFYLSDEQKTVAEKLIGLLETKGYDVVTEVTKASAFYAAEDYHQDYYDTKGTLPYCHFYQKKF